jgi:hypothetical protein
MYLFLLVIIGILVFLIIHPLINFKSGKTYMDRLTKIYGGFSWPLIMSIAGGWFGETITGWGPAIHNFAFTGGLIGSVVLVCIWDGILIKMSKK